MLWFGTQRHRSNEWKTMKESLKCLLQGPAAAWGYVSEKSLACRGNVSLSLFLSNSIIWPSPLGSFWIPPKTKNPFLSLLSLSDKPPHFTPAQPADGKSERFLSLAFIDPWIFFGGEGGAQWIHTFEVGVRLHTAWFALPSWSYRVGISGTLAGLFWCENNL